MNIIKKIYNFTNGYKAIAGYLIAQLFGTYPLVAVAWKQVIATPTQETVANAIAQTVLALGIGHLVLKRLGISEEK